MNCSKGEGALMWCTLHNFFFLINKLNKQICIILRGNFIYENQRASETWLIHRESSSTMRLNKERCAQAGVYTIRLKRKISVRVCVRAHFMPLYTRAAHEWNEQYRTLFLCVGVVYTAVVLGGMCRPRDFVCALGDSLHFLDAFFFLFNIFYNFMKILY